jgi:HK97 family phage prohead protease
VNPTIIDPMEIRARPALLTELRDKPGQHIERRFAALSEVRAADEEEPGGFKFGGLAAVFDELSLNLGGFRERIDRGAFRKVLANNPDVRALFNHDPNYPLARTLAPGKIGSLRIKEVGKGLDYEAIPTPTTYAQDLRVNLEAGVVSQSSFAFRIAPGGDSWDEDTETGALIRTIHEFSELFDVSPVTDPAYPKATSGLRDANRDGIPSTSSEQHDDQGGAQQPVDQGSEEERDTDGTEAPAGDHWMVAARQRRLRQLQRIAGC